VNVYFDGGYFDLDREGKQLKKKEHVAAWGIVIDNGEMQTEIMAFAETILWLDSHEVAPAEVAFYGDDQTSIYGALSYNAGWLNDAHYRNLVGKLKWLISAKHLPAEILTKMMPYIEGSRFHKVKGHKRCVNNCRCDYLCKVAYCRRVGKRCNLLDFLTYVNTGFSVWAKGVNTQWFPPTFNELSGDPA
jgi:ribonuclease HI